MVTFLQLPRLARALDAVPPAPVVHLKVWAPASMDHTCAELLADWMKRRSTSGARAEVDRRSAARHERLGAAPELARRS